MVLSAVEVLKSIPAVGEFPLQLPLEVLHLQTAGFCLCIAQDCSDLESHYVAPKEACPDPKTKCSSAQVLTKTCWFFRAAGLLMNIISLFRPILKHSWKRKKGTSWGRRFLVKSSWGQVLSLSTVPQCAG